MDSPFSIFSFFPTVVSHSHDIVNMLKFRGAPNGLALLLFMSCGQEVLKTIQFKSGLDDLKNKVCFIKKSIEGGEMEKWLING